MQDQLNNDDLLDQATAALRNTPVTQGPSEDLIAQTLSRLEAESDSDRSTFNWKIFIMKHRPLAAAAVVIIVSAGCPAVVFPGSSNFAFGAVLEKVRPFRPSRLKCTERQHRVWQSTGHEFHVQCHRAGAFQNACKIEPNHNTIMIIDATQWQAIDAESG